ncbi:MAG TPA: DUF1343 domain-containing protein [Longimicrobiaceae bacterium]
MRLVGLLAATAVLMGTITAGCSVAQETPSSAPGVVTGLEVLLSDPPESLLGKRIGLITNHTGIDREGVSGIDRLVASPLKIVALFTPEHGLRGTAAPGEQVASGTDSRTGLPVHSLYGDTRKPTAGMLADVDVLVFDIQDVGARQYTYISTMALGMQAAAEKGIPFVVLDRPNPIGGEIVEGGLLDPGFASFVGMYPIPSRHGMTVGELARLFNARFEIGADLAVVRMEGWTRATWFDETGLPWVNPSPNIRRLEAAAHYPGTVYLEGTNLSEGRGTDLPFEQTGAPWLDAASVAEAMNALGLSGVRFEAVRIQVDSTAGKYPGESLPGVRLVMTDRATYRPIETVLRLIDLIRRTHPEEFKWGPSMDRLAGTDQLRGAIDAGKLDELLARWRVEAENFAREREPFLLYP